MGALATLDSPADADLVQAARAGNPTAFRALVERHKGLVYSLAYAILGNADRSDEVAQEALVTAWRRLDEMQEPGRFRGWISGITRLIARQARHRRRVHWSERGL